MTAPPPLPETPPPRAVSERRLSRLPWRTYPLRVLGMGLAALPAVVVLRELQAGPPAWAWVVFGCVLWPHLAYLHATRSGDPFRAELRNFMFDSFIAGSFVPMMHFTLLPSALLLTVVTADKINSGVRGLWLRSLPGVALAILVSGLLNGFQLRIETSTAVLVACLPIMMIHTLAVSGTTYQLVRRLQRQNLALDELNRRDGLTGLLSRGHWLMQADALLRRHQEESVPATLVLVDVDQFKSINDRYGHSTGDEVLRGLAEAVRGLGVSGLQAGRLGGDEFALVLPTGFGTAATHAETLRAAVESLAFPRFPGLHCSISLGLAEPPDAGLGLREWLEAADRALYEAKHSGRNRSVGRGQASAPGGDS